MERPKQQLIYPTNKYCVCVYPQPDFAGSSVMFVVQNQIKSHNLTKLSTLNKYAQFLIKKVEPNIWMIQTNLGKHYVMV